MTREEYTKFVCDAFGEKEEHPFADDLKTSVFRHTENKKWFALIITVPRNRLGLYSDKPIDIVNLKCDPLLSGSLFSECGIFPAYHMNKEKWISVLLDESVDEDRLQWLTSISFELTNNKIKKRKKYD